MRPAPATVASIAIRTAEFGAAFDFLTGVCGLPVAAATIAYRGRLVAWIGDETFRIEVLAAPAAPPGFAEISHLALAVPSLDTAVAAGVAFDDRGPFRPDTGRPGQPLIAFSRPIRGPPRLQFRETS